MKGEDLKEYVQRFNRKVVLIPDLQDGIVYTAFLNGLLPNRFKFSLAESKVTTLADALRKLKTLSKQQRYVQEMSSSMKRVERG